MPIKPASLRPLADQIADLVLRLAGRVPRSELTLSDTPQLRAEAIARAASKKAAAISAGLAMPPGPWGLATVLPDLLLIWELQSRMVADIAAVYGKSATLSREQMIWCLFKHTGAQALRDVAVRSGQRWLVRQLSQGALQQLAQKIGLKLSQRALGNSAARFVPLIGAAGVGAYAWRDTQAVARAAIELFAADIAPAADSADSLGAAEDKR